MHNRSQHQFAEVILAYNSVLSLCNKHGRGNNVVAEKEKIEFLNFLGHKFDFDSESENVSLFKGNSMCSD